MKSSIRKSLSRREGSIAFKTQSIFFLTFCAVFCTASAIQGCRQPPALPPGYAAVGLDTAPLTLDPRFTTDATSSQIEELLFDGLTRVDEQQQRIAHLATTWETPDPTTYVFHLRPAVRFADGSPLTADDVKATYEAVLSPIGKSPKREPLTVIDGIDVIDPLTIRFRLREPFAAFLTTTGLGILSRAQLAAAPTGPLTLPIGSGAFRLTMPATADTIVLDRNPEHTLGPAQLRGVAFRVIPDAITRLLEIRRGTLDLVQTGIEPDALAWLRDQKGLQVVTAKAASLQYLGLNLRDPRFADRRVRRAIAYAIDRDAIVDTVLKGLAETASGVLPPSHWAYFGKSPTYHHDPARARRLLDRAGWHDPDGDGPAARFRIIYKTTNIELRRRIAEVLQAQLAAVGIELEIRSYEWATFYGDIRRGDFEMYSLAWVGVEDPDIYYLTLHSSQIPPQGLNRGFYVDAQVDRLAEAARHSLDPSRRRRLYAAVQIRAARQLPVIPLWWPSITVVTGQRLRGFAASASGSYRGLQAARLE